MRIGEIARRLGVSSDFLRRVERLGLVRPANRDLNGHRRYTVEDLEAVQAAIFPTRVRDTVEGRARIGAEIARLKAWCERNGIPWDPPEAPAS